MHCINEFLLHVLIVTCCTLSENSDLFRICVVCFMYDVSLFVCHAMLVFEHTHIYMYVLLHQ